MKKTKTKTNKKVAKKVNKKVIKKIAKKTIKKQINGSTYQVTIKQITGAPHKLYGTFSVNVIRNVEEFNRVLQALDLSTVR